MDRVAGFLDGGMEAWASEGFPTGQIQQLSGEELHAHMQEGGALTVVDVRAPDEFEGGHIEGAVNIPAPDLRMRYTELDRTLPIVTICRTGQRSSLAGSAVDHVEPARRANDRWGGMHAAKVQLRGAPIKSDGVDAGWRTATPARDTSLWSACPPTKDCGWRRLAGSASRRS